MTDETEGPRRHRLAEINEQPANRSQLETKYGTVWDTNQLQKEFEVHGFMAPYVVVKRKRDGVMCSLEFQHSPRLYFNLDEGGGASGRR